MKKLQPDLQRKKLRSKKRLKGKQLYRQNLKLSNKRRKVRRKRNEEGLRQDTTRLEKLRTCINLFKIE